MVELYLRYDEVEMRLAAGKLMIAAPCGMEYQQELLYELQKKKSRFRITDEIGNNLKFDTPILVVKQLMNLDGNELEKYYQWWSDMFKLKGDEQDPYFDIIPKKQTGWAGLKIEKRIALFLGAAMKSTPLCYAFMGDLHLDQNAQIFLFNFLKNISDSSQNRAIITWTYRMQITNTVPLYFKGFAKDVT